MNLDEELDEWGRTRVIDDEQLLALIRRCATDDAVIEVNEGDTSIPTPIWDDFATPPIGVQLLDVLRAMP